MELRSPCLLQMLLRCMSSTTLLASQWRERQGRVSSLPLSRVSITVHLFRNVLVESARIARGAISPLSQLEVNQFAALVFPGGFGAAKNL